MKKVIRLTESDLTRIVNRVIKENEDDDFSEHEWKYREMNKNGIAQVVVVPATGAEQFAKFIYDKVSEFIKIETEGRVRVVSVEFMEHNKNTAIYGE